jgi:hypothetical protein
MLKLHDVTLFALSSIYINETISSLLKSSEQIEFGSIKILTHEKPSNLPEKIEYAQIPKINDIMDYNKFCFYELGQYIDTSHGLLTQYHAWIINPDSFDNSWLQSDYIGGLWPLKEGSYKANTGEIIRNGNGGFSLRSKRIMSIPKKLKWPMREDQGFYNEDGALVCYFRKEMLELGIQYASAEISAIFSYETPMIENWGKKVFGFHRNYPPWEHA